MSGWRKFGLIAAASFLPLVLFAWGFIFTSYQMLATPERLKDTLDSSGIYETFISDILKQAENKENGQPSEGEKIPTDQPEVKKAIQDAASPEFLKTQVEGFLDNTYAWLQGETEHLAFQINLTDVKAKLSEGLVSAAHSRLASLPACDGPINTNADFDPFTAECIPRGADTNAAAEKIRGEIDKLIEKPVITQDDVNKEDGKSLEQQLQAIPGLYNNLVLGMWLGALLVLLLAAAVILLSVPWRLGLKRVGIIFMTVGGASIILALLAAYLIKLAAETVGEEGEIRTSALTVISQLADGFRGWWVKFGVIVLLLGGAALIATIILKRRETPQHNAAKTSEQEKAETPLGKDKTTPEKPEKKEQNK